MLGKVLSLLSCLSHKTSSSQGISVVPWFGLDKEGEQLFFFFLSLFHEKRGKLYGTQYVVYSAATLHDGFLLNDFPSDLFTCTHMPVVN